MTLNSSRIYTDGTDFLLSLGPTRPSAPCEDPEKAAERRTQAPTGDDGH
jgi:hypothetical protein